MLLEVALEKRGHPLSWEKHASFADALKYYSDLLQREFKKEIIGDFSAYPAIEYRVELNRLVESNGSGLPKPKRDRIGVYSELSTAENRALVTLSQVLLGPHDSVSLIGTYEE